MIEEALVIGVVYTASALMHFVLGAFLVSVTLNKLNDIGKRTRLITVPIFIAYIVLMIKDFPTLGAPLAVGFVWGVRTLAKRGLLYKLF